MPYTPSGPELRAGRVLLGLPLQAIADRLGTSAVTIHRIECSKAVSSRFQRRMRAVLMLQGIEFAEGGWVRRMLTDQEQLEQEARAAAHVAAKLARLGPQRRLGPRTLAEVLANERSAPAALNPK